MKAAKMSPISKGESSPVTTKNKKSVRVTNDT